MFRTDGERRSFSMARDMTVIGRREDCDLRIPLGEVSRKHCRILRDGDIVSIDTGEVIEGALPKVASRLVKEWTLARGGLWVIHRSEIARGRTCSLMISLATDIGGS